MQTFLSPLQEKPSPSSRRGRDFPIGVSFVSVNISLRQQARGLIERCQGLIITHGCFPLPAGMQGFPPTSRRSAGPQRAGWAIVLGLGQCPRAGVWSWVIILGLGHGPGLGHHPGAGAWSWAIILGKCHCPGDVPQSWGCSLNLGMCPGPGDEPPPWG